MSGMSEKNTKLSKLKSVYKSAPSFKKTKMLVMPICIAMSVIFFMIALATFLIVANQSATLVDKEISELRRLHYNDVDEEVRERFDRRLDSITEYVSGQVNGLAWAFIIVSLVVSGGMAFVSIRLIVKVQHNNISKPLMELVYKARKANEGLENLGIAMAEDTEDEIALIQSVYFNIVEKLKEHVDDVSNLSVLTEKFENSAHFDPLTGVYNRRRFTELVEKHAVIAAKKNEPTFVCMLDLDFFKKVNDTYGHDAGDAVLKNISGRVKDTMRPYDLFARYGGEEFIMFIAVPDSENAVCFAERIREIIQAAPVHFEGTDIPVTASLGVAQAAPHNLLDAAIKLADKALYSAKKNGRNRVELFED